MPTAPRRRRPRRPSGSARALYPLLLRAWRIAPLPPWLRGLILWCGNQRYLIGVAGLVFDAEGRLLLGRHSYLPPPGWSLPGGWLQAGEGLETCARRELQEELGLIVEVGPLIAWAEVATPRHYAFGFQCTPRGGAFRPSAEILEVAYFPLDEAGRLVPRPLRPLVLQVARWEAAAREGR